MGILYKRTRQKHTSYGALDVYGTSKIVQDLGRMRKTLKRGSMSTERMN